MLNFGQQISASQYSLILRSTDAGVSWSSVLKINSIYSATLQKFTVGRIYDIATQSTDGTVYFVAVSETGQVYTSSNSAVNWKKSSQLDAALYGISMGRNGIAYAVGVSNTSQQAVIFQSSNSSGYSNWIKASLSTNVISQLNSVSTYDGVSVYTVGLHGVLYSSRNSGLNWTLTYPGATLCPGVDLYSISVSSSTSGQYFLILLLFNRYLL